MADDDEMGDFFLADVDVLFELSQDLPDVPDELADLFDEDFSEFTEIPMVSTVPNINDMKQALEENPAPSLSIPNSTLSHRFKKLSEHDIKELDKHRQSESTKRNTQWGVKTFQEWCIETEGKPTDLVTITPEDLNLKLRQFYAEAQPKNIERREKMMPANQAREYHKNSLKSVRSAINRYLQDNERGFDIVRDIRFKTSNNILDAKLKFNLKEGLSRPTKQKEIISPADLLKINSYLCTETNPVILRYRVWYCLAVHFVSRGIEFHQQLGRNSFKFNFDENNKEYVTIAHETKQKNRQGGVSNDEAAADKRMYSTNDKNCPVAALKLFIEKTDPNAQSLFNHCSKDALASHLNENVWYTTRPVKQYQFSRFMTEISKHSGCSRIYVNHCLRATSIQAMNDAGFELRHIMFMSGHRNESSVRTYNRYCSDEQKRRLSETLSTMTTFRNSDPDQYGDPVFSVSKTHALQPAKTSTITRPTISDNFNNQSLNSNNVLSSGFISHSAFNNCVFHFTNNN